MSGVAGPLDIAIFPLNTVLFPGGFLPLRIFEPRYLQMVSDCVQQQVPFGVALIRDGQEAGSLADPFDTGTLATIVDFDKSKDGVLLIAALGGERFRILRRRADASRLLRAEVEILDEGDDFVLPPRHEPLAGFLRAVVNQPGISRRIAPPDIDYGSPREIGYRLAEMLPIALEQQQQLLEADNPVERLDRIDALLRDMDYTLDA